MKQIPANAWHARALFFGICLLCAGLWGPPARAQSGAAALGEGAALELDLRALLLRDPASIVPSVTDNVWTFSAAPGKKLLQLPVIVTAGKQPLELTYGSISVRGGRFICWKLLDPLTPVEVDPDDQRRLALAGDVNALPQDAPRSARGLIVLPNGRMQWKLDRFSKGAEVGQGGRYALKLDFDLLKKSQPASPTVRPNDPSYASVMSAYRVASATYRDLREEIRTLPSEFEDKMPARIWAVFEISERFLDLEIECPSFTWKIALENLDRLRSMAQPATATDGLLPVEKVLELRTVSALLSADKQPYTIRLAANAAAASDLARVISPNDVGFQVLAQLLGSEDMVSRRLVVKEVVETVPPTAASRQLWAMAGQDLLRDSSIQADRFKGLLKMDLSDPRQVQEILAATHQVLNDPAGLPPAQLIDDLIATANADSRVFSYFTTGLNFADMPDARRDLAIAAVLERSATEPLAQGWLNQKLLGSTDIRIVKRTLQILNAADAGSPVVREGMQSLLNMVFGSAPLDAAQESIPHPHIAGLIPVDSSRHNVFKALQYGNAQVRELAWDALRHFAFALPPAPVENNPNALRSDDDPYRLLVDAALAQQPTPASAVDFLLRQPDINRSTDGLDRILMRGSERASVRASRALLGSNRPIESLVMKKGVGERHGFARQMYGNLTRRSPMVLALLRDRGANSPVAIWFARSIAAGILPEPGEWVQGTGGESIAIEYVASADPDLARAAVAALVASVGVQDERISANIAKKFLENSDRTVPVIREAWLQIKPKLYLDSLSKSAGTYIMTLYLGRAGDGETIRLSDGLGAEAGKTIIVKAGDHPFVVDREIPVGRVTLDIKEDGVRMGPVALSIPPEQLALVIERVADLKNFPKDELSKLPLEDVPDAVELQHAADGTWHAYFFLSDRRPVELVLTPAGS